MEQCLERLRMEGIPNDSELLHKREVEIRHAQDVREQYEQKLQTADKLFKDLKSCKNHLDAKKKELQRQVWCDSRGHSYMNFHLIGNRCFSQQPLTSLTLRMTKRMVAEPRRVRAW